MTEEFKTSDINFAAYLSVADVPLLDTERDPTNPRRIIFVFESMSASAMRELKKGYFSGEAKVSAKRFADALRNFKSLVHM